MCNYNEVVAAWNVDAHGGPKYSQKIDGLQRENKQLKKSIYDLSVRYDNLAAEKSIHNGRAGGPKMQPFDLDAIFATSGPDISESMDNYWFWHGYIRCRRRGIHGIA